KRDRNQISYVEKLNIFSLFDNFARDLMPKDQSFRGRRAPSNHVLIGPANIRAYNLQNDSMLDIFALRILHLRVIDRLDLHFALSKINNTPVGCHCRSPFASIWRSNRAETVTFLVPASYRSP